MQTVSIILVIVYLLTTVHFLINWLKFLQRKTLSSPEDLFLSLLVLTLVVIFWPVMIPISCLEFLKARDMQLSNVMPVVIGLFVVSLLTVSGLAAFVAVIH